MADFSALKQSIQNYIKQNGNKEITGAILQKILLSMVTTMGDGAINDNASDISDIKGDIQNINGSITDINGLLSAITTRLNTGALYAGYATPSTTPAALTSQEVFYLATQAGTYTNFHFNGGDDPIVLTKDGIYFIVSGTDDDDWNAEPILLLDEVPTASSNNAVKSGGVAEELALGAVYDVSAKNPTAGHNNDGKWESLSALLSDANLNTIIPTSVRKGGMSIKFVCSVDNKYVQYRLMSDEWNTNTEDWAIAEEIVYIENPEFVYVKTDNNGKILWAIKADGDIYYGAGCPQQVIDYIEQKIEELSLDEYEDMVAFLNDLEKGDKTLQTLLDEKLDKEDGKSLIDAEYAYGVHYIENPEFAGVWLDGGGKILFGIEQNGNFLFGCGVPKKVKEYIEEKIEELSLDEYESIVTFIGDYLNNTTLEELLSKKVDGEYVDNPEFAEVHTDADDRVLYGVKQDGDFYFGAGIPSQIQEELDNKVAEVVASKVDKEEGKSLIDEEYASTKSTIDNPEFLDVTTDNEGKVLEGIQEDGTKVIGGNLKVLGSMEVSGVSYKIIENPEYLAAWVDAGNKVIFGLKTDGKTYVGDADFLNDIESIKAFLANFNDKNIDWDALTSITATDNPEYIEAKTDSEGKLLAGRTPDGTAFENVGLKTPKVSIDGHTIENIEDPEGRSEITTDSEGKIISYRDSDGVKYEEVGIDSVVVNTNSLNLSAEGMTDFQQALKDSGFRPGGAGDYTDKNSMYISEPRLAHLNIIGDVVLENLSKEGMSGAVEGVNYNVPIVIEYCDDKGNYFKKYALLSGQGRSSLNFIKKGLGMDFFNEDPNAQDFDEDNTFKMKFGDWIYQDSFHVKSFYTDWPRCTTPAIYKLAFEVINTRGIMEDRPYKKYYVGNYSDGAWKNAQSDLSQNMETGARCIPDGFPVIVYHNGEFWGVNSLQLKKHRDNYMLKKSKDTNVHLDGDQSHRADGTLFWLWNGNIHWNAYCSPINGIETRNPKNLYCIDGKKYNVDTHNMEIIDTATAEAWIASGVITPTGKTIDDEIAGYLRTTGKVRKHIEDLTTYIPYINGLADGSILIDGQQATTAQIRAAIADRFDVKSFIDYILIGNVTGNTDAWDNNGQIITWGKLSGSNNLNWSVNVYDCDITFGCIWNGTIASPANNTKYGNELDENQNAKFPLYKIFWDYYFDELKERYKELRDAKIFDAEHIVGIFRDWMNRVGYDNYKKEYEKWPESPCFRNGNRTYPLNPTNQGFYGSIYRIYLYVKKRIEYMDDANFFDYNN